MNMLPDHPLSRWAALALLSFALPLASASAQTAAAPAEDAETEVIEELSPFEVLGSEDEGYRATHTLAGTRIRTSLEDVGSAIQVITSEFLRDTNVTDNQSLLQYTTNTEVGGVDGNFGGAGNGVAVNESFSNPSTTTRVRGLAAADNTRNFFLTQIPWDGYNVDRVDIQRGPNAILFGFGSPAGIINTSLVKPFYENAYKWEFAIDGEGSLRNTLDVNQELLQDQLAVRITGLYDKEKFKQDPAYEDDRRVYAALKYEPSFLKRDWGRTALSAYYENGDIVANRPRTITPGDRISYWFNPVRTIPGNNTSPFNPAGGVGKGVFTPEQLEDNNSGNPNRGQNRSTLASDGSANPYYIPMVGNYGQVFGGPIAFISDPSTGVISDSRVTEFLTTGGIGPSGAIDGSVGGIPFSRMASVDIFSQFAKDARLPYANFGQFKNTTLSDTSIFDFYNYLLDGPNKSEGQDWENYNLALTQTFFRDRLGFELAYDAQDYVQDQTSIITDSRQAIHIDINSHYTDGSPNPNVGRPFITDSAQFGNGMQDSERRSLRFTAFGEHNFTDYGKNFFLRLLGRQNLTFLASQEETETRSTSWQRHTMGQDYRTFFNRPNITDNLNAFNPSFYLGPSLLSASSAVNARIPAVTAEMQIPDSTNVFYWDSTWIGTGVNPADPWTRPYYGGVSTQSENPANYRGWTTRTFSIEKADFKSHDNLATNGSIDRAEIKSTAVVLQNYFWDGAFVGTYGWRKDEADAFSVQAAKEANTQRARIEAMVLPTVPGQTVEAETESYSGVLHLHRLPFLKENLPLGISLYYNKSENFQPAAGRVDLFGRTLAPPSGQTEDRSILIQTKDGKYSVKITKFETDVLNSSADRIQGDWFLGSFQAWGHNWMNIFELNNNNGAFNSPTGENTFAPKPGQTQADADAEEAAAIAGWKAHIQNLRNLSEELTGNPNAFDETYQINRTITSKNGISATTPSNLAFSQDASSEGYEIEFNARPLENWNIALNVAQVEAVRTNVGGEALIRYVNLVNQDLAGPAGDLRLWWGSAGSPTFRSEWNSTFNSNFNLTKLLEGTAAPELREWRFNLVTNYSFREGFFRNWNIGGGYRWQDDVIIGFRPEYTDATQTDVTFDLDNPYYGPSEDSVDLWVGYQRKLFEDKVNWRMQVNIRNLFADDSLIPINTQPDGSVAAWRLGAKTQFTFTNTFSF